MSIGGPNEDERRAALQRKGVAILVLPAAVVLLLTGRLAALQLQRGSYYMS